MAWFEIGKSSVSNVPRELTRPPLGLVQQIENPTSGRETWVRLTDDGRAFVDGMIAESVGYLGQHLQYLNQQQLDWGIQFFKLAFNRLADDVRGGRPMVCRSRPSRRMPPDYRRNTP